eukprot:Nk52_evm36s2192 gene=Nk52_evmTU36s2192
MDIINKVVYSTLGSLPMFEGLLDTGFSYSDTVQDREKAEKGSIRGDDNGKGRTNASGENSLLIGKKSKRVQELSKLAMANTSTLDSESDLNSFYSPVTSHSNVSFSLGFPDSEKIWLSTHERSINYYTSHSDGELDAEDDNNLTAKFQKRFGTLHTCSGKTHSANDLDLQPQTERETNSTLNKEAVRHLTENVDQGVASSKNPARGRTVVSTTSFTNTLTLEEKVNHIHAMIEDIYHEVAGLKEDMGMQAADTTQLKISQKNAMAIITGIRKELQKVKPPETEIQTPAEPKSLKIKNRSPLSITPKEEHNQTTDSNTPSQKSVFKGKSKKRANSYARNSKVEEDIEHIVGSSTLPWEVS